MLKVCTARSKVFAWKLKLSWWPCWPPKLFVYFTHSNIAKREIMWRVFALLIYGTHSCKLKLKRLTWCKKTFLSNNKFELFGADADWILSVSELDLDIEFCLGLPPTQSHGSCKMTTNYCCRLTFLFWQDYILRNGFQIKNALNVKLLGHFCNLSPKYSWSSPG